MPVDGTLLRIAAALGGLLQVGIGIGFSVSVIVGPLLFLTIGAHNAVPLLLLLNVVVSLIATPGTMELADRRPVIRAALACIAGIMAGMLVYPHLSEAALLVIAGGLLVVGAVITLLPVPNAGRRAILPVSGLSGLAPSGRQPPAP